MAPCELSRKDPPSPPRPPNPPPPSPETKKHNFLELPLNLGSLSRQDPPSPPRAPPPSPTKNTKKAPTTAKQLTESTSTNIFPKLVELTITLGDILEIPTSLEPEGKISYTYCEDDMSVPGSPPPLVFTPPRCRGTTKRRAAELHDDSEEEPPLSCLIQNFSPKYKRRRTIIELEDALLLLPQGSDIATPNNDFFSALFSKDHIYDASIMQEHVHGIRSCA
ncbi:hypothetical protein ABW20_dc0106834 [Dactylellina cionopaga]|nr:hypothetical protein ABW20_dc0106834 [Dactylellina cionopaga]